jgi:DNA ligase-1
MMRSRRHESGYALRFPRIVRIRTDKSAEEIDTLETVREIFAKQDGGRGQRQTG